MLKVKSVEGFEFELEGLAEQLVREDPKVKVMITPMDKKGELLDTLEAWSRTRRSSWKSSMKR
jgi:hypothetical protein